MTLTQVATTLIGADPTLLARSDELIATLNPNLLRLARPRPGALGTFEVTDPGTDRVIASVADAGGDDAVAAVDAAYGAGRAWAATTLRHRSDVLRRAYDLVVERSEQFALLISREMGKPLAEARGEVTYGSDFIRWYAEEAVRPGGNYRPSPYGDGRLLTARSPVGVCLLITPWNFPLAMATRKIAPALAAGCTVILKPAALTPLTSLLFADTLRDAGVPDGVVNVVTTSSPAAVSEAVMADARIRKVSFTGSTAVGIRLLAQAAPQVLRTSMELGGNAPFLVLDDADLDRAVAGALKAKLRNGGQSCIAANRFLVQDGIADAFEEAFTGELRQLRVGHGLGEGVDLGPVIDATAQTRLASLVEGAVREGAELVLGGSPISGAGTFFPPTVLTGVRPEASIAQEEIFGPIATITRFHEGAEGVALANSTPYGLAGYIFSQDLDRALSTADRLETGMVGINQGVVSNVAAPFGGVKHSGLGREGSHEGLDEYSNVRFYNLSHR